MKQLAFLSGLPRTGSTVLGTLLSQHPELHPTATSVLVNHVEHLSKFYFGETLYYNRHDPSSPYWGMVEGMLQGYYKNIDKHTVLDKSRRWSKNIHLLRGSGISPKVVATVRPVPEIISSFITLANKVGPLSQVHQTVIGENRTPNEWTMSRIIWERYVYEDWRALKKGFENHPECFLLVRYDDIVSRPVEVTNTISDFLEVSRAECITEGLENPVPENDRMYGMPGLHTVRPTLEKVSEKPEKVLGTDCYQFWVNKKLEFWHG